jgi:hypothetical protein
MPSQHGFGDDGTKATRFHKPDDGNDQMKKKGQDVAHPRHRIKISKSRGIRTDFVIRHRQDVAANL